MAVAHSVLGASSASRWMTCAGSYRVSQAVTEPARPSRWAAQGSAAHAIAEELLTRGGPIDQALGETRQHDGHDILVDREMIEAVEIYLNEINPIIADADVWACEQQVSLDSYWYPDFPPVRLFGTCDLFAYNRPRRRLTIADYKNGAGVYVSHVDNKQMFYYAAGALALLEDVHNETALDVEMIVVQPRVPGYEPVRRQILPVIDLLMWVDRELIPAVAATQRGDATLVMGDHCRWCPGRVICPALQAAKLRATQKAFSPVVNDVLVDATEAELADYLDDAERLETWIAGVREVAQHRIEDGIRVPGWGLAPTRPRRVWVDPVQAELALKANGANDIWEEPSLRSPAQMEKHVSAKTWRAVQSLIEARSSGLKLARQISTSQPFEKVSEDA
jgi:Protein of unknown function (DUF2800)